jgi:hypothetical protein
MHSAPSVARVRLRDRVFANHRLRNLPSSSPACLNAIHGTSIPILSLTAMRNSCFPPR